ncbi:MAG: S-layer homology domain-containing protein, partial [Clostridiaceae bacterium]|nr:S-layer homology domain-containing protein [Clostridiaceae bacterium]
MKKRFLSIFLAFVMCLSVFPTVALADGISFTDVKTSDWFYNDVKIAVETGLVNGKSATIYAPEDNLTYAEAVKLAACMHQLYSTGSVTLKNGTPWYQSFVDYCKLNGIISDDYQWSANINRAGYMDIFSRALPDTALAAINMVADGSVPDVPMTHKNAASIYKLYRAGIVQGVDAAHNCNPNSNIKRSEVAAILTRMMNVDKRLSFSIGEPIIDKPEKELKITQQPEDAKGKAGQTISFEVKAEGDGLIYQWQRKEGSEFKDLNDTSSISGSTYNKITVILPSDISGFSFRCRCVVSDKNGKSITSNEAILDVITEVIKELKITQQPEDTKGKAGETVSFEVKAEGDGLTYQWQKKEGSEFKDL